jgi:hypothetical protein
MGQLRVKKDKRRSKYRKSGHVGISHVYVTHEQSEMKAMQKNREEETIVISIEC